MRVGRTAWAMDATANRPRCAGRTRVHAGRGRRIFTDRGHSATPAWRLIVLVAVALAVRDARADLTAAYDGSLAMTAETAAVAAALNQKGVRVSGTLALESADGAAGGVYFVSGQMRKSRLVLVGTNSGGTRFRWRAVSRGDGSLHGRVMLRGPGG